VVGGTFDAMGGGGISFGGISMMADAATSGMIAIAAALGVNATAFDYHFGVPQFAKNIVIPKVPVGETFKLDLSKLLPPAVTPYGNVLLPNLKTAEMTETGQLKFTISNPDPGKRFKGTLNLRAVFANGAYQDVVTDIVGDSTDDIVVNPDQIKLGTSKYRFAIGTAKWQLVRMIPEKEYSGSGKLQTGDPIEFAGNTIRITPRTDMAAILTRNKVTFIREQEKGQGAGNLVKMLGEPSSFPGPDAGTPNYLTGTKVQPVTFTDNLSSVYVGGNGVVYQIDMLTFRIINTIDIVPAGKNISSLATTGDWLIIGEGNQNGGKDNRLFVMNIDPGSKNYNKMVSIKESDATKADPAVSLSLAPFGVSGMTIGPDGRTLVVAANINRNSVSLGDPKKRGIVLVFNLDTLDFETGKIDAPVPVKLPEDGISGKSPQVITATRDPDRFLVANVEDYDRGLSTLVITRNDDGKPLSAKMGAIKMNQDKVNIDRLNIQRAQSAVLVKKDGIEYAIVSDDNYNFNDTYWMGMFEVPIFVSPPSGPPIAFGGSATAKKVAVGGKLGIVKDPFGEKPEFLGATLPLDGYGIVNLSISEDGKVLLGQLKGGFGTQGTENANESKPNENHVWDVDALITAALAMSKEERAIKHIKLPAAAEQLIGKPGDKTVFGPVGTFFDAEAGLKMLAPEGIAPGSFKYPNTPITPTFKWEVTLASPYEKDKTSLLSNFYISVFNPSKSAGLFPGSPLDKLGKKSSIPKVGLPPEIFEALPQVDGKPEEKFRDTYVGRSYTALEVTGTYDPNDKKLHFELKLPPEAALTASQDYYAGATYVVTAKKTDPANPQKGKTGITQAPSSFNTNSVKFTTPTLQGNPGKYTAVTVITHGYQPPVENKSVVDTKSFVLGQGLATRTGGGLFVYDPKTGNWLWYDASVKDLNERLVDSAKSAKKLADYRKEGKPIFLVSDWYSESGITTTGFAEAAADAIFASLLKLNKDNNNALQDVPMHFIGHSRGTIVNSEIIQRIGQYGDGQFGIKPSDLQMTDLDVHDFDQASQDIDHLKNQFADPNVLAWKNVSFLDNYYEQAVDELKKVSNVKGLTTNPNGRPLQSGKQDPKAPLLSGEIRTSGANIDQRLDAIGPDGNPARENSMPGFQDAGTWESANPFGSPIPHSVVQDWYAGTALLNTKSVDKKDENKYDLPIWRNFDDSSSYKPHWYKDQSYVPWYVSRRDDKTIVDTSPKTALEWIALAVKRNKTTVLPASKTLEKNQQPISFEGGGEGWFYSILGGGASFRPKFVGTPVDVFKENSERPLDGIKGLDKSALQVFDGNFQVSSNGFDDRFLKTYDVPGWSINNGDQPAVGENAQTYALATDNRSTRTQFLNLRLNWPEEDFRQRIIKAFPGLNTTKGKELISRLYSLLMTDVAPALDRELDKNFEAIDKEVRGWSLVRDKKHFFGFAEFGQSLPSQVSQAIWNVEHQYNTAVTATRKYKLAKISEGLFDLLFPQAAKAGWYYGNSPDWKPITEQIRTATGIDIYSPNNNFTGSLWAQYANGDKPLVYSLAARDNYAVIHNRMVIPPSATSLKVDVAVVGPVLDEATKLYVYWLDDSVATNNAAALAALPATTAPAWSIALYVDPVGVGLPTPLSLPTYLTQMSDKITKLQATKPEGRLAFMVFRGIKDLGNSNLDIRIDNVHFESAALPQNVAVEGPNNSVPPLTESDINAVIGTARQYWLNAGVPAAKLGDVTITAGTLAVGVAGETVGDQITISADGAGWGWFVDSTPASQEEFLSTGALNQFQAVAGGAAEGKLDLLTVLVHELGHVLGLTDTADNTEIMALDLAPGMRRLPSADDIIALQGQIALLRSGAAAPAGTTGGQTLVIPQQIGNGNIVNPWHSVAVASTLTNGNFGAATAGWQTGGNFTLDGNGEVVLGESSNADAHLAQGFMINNGDRFLSFTVADDQLQDNSPDGPSDAFEVTLLNATTGAAVGATDGLTHSDALLNIQTDGTERTASNVHKVANADGTVTYYIDLQQGIGGPGDILAGTPVLVSFDLIGFGGEHSTVSLRDIHLIRDPVALDDQFTTEEDTTLILAPLSNDLIGGGSSDTHVLELITSPIHGNLTPNPDGSFSYLPEANFFGVDSFTYRYTIDGQSSNIATVNITVNPVNDAPTAPDASGAIMAGRPFTFDPLAGAFDVEGSPLSATILIAPAHGSVVFNDDGSWTYTAEVTYAGADLLTYQVSDGESLSTPVTMFVTVLPANTAPIAHDAAVQVREDGTLVIDLTAFGSDAENDTLIATITAQATHGTLIEASDGTWIYTPEANYFGTDDVSFILSDGRLISTEAILSITIVAVNDAPTLMDQTATLDEDGSITIDPLASATDIDGDTLVATVVAGPTHGTLTVTADGSVNYRPDAEYFGSDSYTYRINDGQADSNIATVNLTVNPVNDAPVARDGAVTLDEDASVILDLRSFGLDIDSPDIEVQIVNGPAHGSLTMNSDGTYAYEPVANYNGSDTVQFQLSDGELSSNIATLHLTIVTVNDAPTLGDQTFTLTEDGSAMIDPLESAIDIDGDMLTSTIVAGPTHGTLMVNADGSFTYRPDANYFGSDSYTYRVSDGQADSNIATVNLTITPVNDAPTAADSQVIGTEDTALVLRRSDFAVSDVDNDALTITLTALPVDGILENKTNGLWVNAAIGDRFTQAELDGGTLRFTPAANASGGSIYAATGYGNMRQHYARLSYTAFDGVLTSNAATLTIDIAPVADAPTLQLLGSTVTHQRFNTNWEAAPNVDSQSTLVSGTVFDGWTLVTGIDQHGEGEGLGGGKDGFEIWSNGDQMADVNGRLRTVNAAPGNGNNWLEINDAGGSQHQTLGISRQLTTDKGATYHLSFDLAGRLGYGSDTTRIGVYVDGVRMALYDNTSASTALNWQHANIRFIGAGGSQTIRIVTEANEREKGGRGMMLDNIALNESVQLNHGTAGGNILLQGIEAALTDTDGSETMTLTLAGLPVGSVLSDGVHSFTVTTAGNGHPAVADITGWNTFALALTLPATYNGTLNLQVTATASEGNRSTASVTQAISVQVDAIAQVPTLTLTPGTASLSRSIVDTSWETRCGEDDDDYDHDDDDHNTDHNTDRNASLITSDEYSGWDSLAARSGKTSAFQIWGNNDQMLNAAGQKVAVQAAGGAGQQWLSLNNGVNSGSNSKYQSPGIEREINTIDGAQYTFSLDYAGALGLATANTRIGVYLDGILIGNYNNTSTNSSLNWQALSFGFTGNGQPRTLSVKLEGSTDISTAKGAMIDALKVIETLPNSAGTVYGMKNGNIVLPAITAQLADSDAGSLKTQLLGLPIGATLKDGAHTLKISSTTTTIDLTGWNLAALALLPPTGFKGVINLQVRATTTEAGNGSTATITRKLTVQVLDGTACATPVGVNPYVSYVNNTAVTSTSQGATSLVVSPLVPIASCYAFDAQHTQRTASLRADPSDSDESMETWMQGLSHSISSAFLKEMDRMLKGEK
jgi:hypothetical protein